jgi:phospholipase/lecithinase/hemolysin
MKKLLLVSILCLLGNLLSSCGETLELSENNIRPQQDALLYYSSDEWPLSCYFYDPQGKAFGRDLPIFNQAWVWAKTPEGAHVHAQGTKQGGFLVADKIYYSKGQKIGSVYLDSPGSVLMPEVKTTDDLEKICEESIERYHPHKGYKLMGMAASRSTQLASNFIDNTLPVVIGEKNNKNKISRVVVFGDSISDVNRLIKWTQIMPAYPYFFGRFSNGGTWSDFLADEANVAVLNYAVGGAVTKSNITSSVKEIIEYVKDVGRYFVTGSLRNFINDYRNNELTDGKIPNVDRTLFVLWGGANDFLSKFDKKSEVNNFIDNPDLPGVGSNSIIDQTVLNIIQDAKGLIALGAKNIMIGNLPNIGITPRMAQDNFYKNNTAQDKYTFAKKLSEIMVKYNTSLASAVNKLKAENPDVTIILFDAAQALQNLMNSVGPEGEANFDYGIDLQKSFTQLSAPGQQDIIIGEKCYKGGYLGSNEAQDICDNPSKMLFWDEVHPTAKGHCGIAFILHYQLYAQGLISKKPLWEEYQKVCK